VLTRGGTSSPICQEKGCEHGLAWIKPCYLWMMYRYGWGTKENQETVLAVEISREGFVWALRNVSLSHCVPGCTTTRPRGNGS
jgi:hypothetical protein